MAGKGRRQKPCRVWDDTYPAGRNPAKVPPSTTIGPIEELRTVLIDRKMYITAKVPRIDGLEPQFVYVNVAYYDMDEKKLYKWQKSSRPRRRKK